MTDATIQADATVLVDMSVADLAAHLDGVDLATLQAALAAEQAKGEAARKGAVAALQSAIDGHPEQAAAAAAAADAASQQSGADVSQGGDGGSASDGKGEDVVIPPTPPVVDAASTVEVPLEDAPTNPAAVSAAPPRPHSSLVDALDLRWNELKGFVAALDGEIEGELGELLTFVRAKL